MSGTRQVGTQIGIDERLTALRLQAMAGQVAKRFGQRMRGRRDELGLTQREVAERIAAELPEMAVDKQRVSDWERGYNLPSDRYKPGIVKALEVDDVSYFYSQPDDERETPEPFAAGGIENADVLAALAALDAKLTQVLQALERRPAEDDLHRLFEEYIRRLGPEVARRRIPPRRKRDLPPEAPPTAA